MTKPLIGETFTECKQFLWGLIHSSQHNIDELIEIKKTTKSITVKTMIPTVIEKERQYIKDIYRDLKELQRWFKASKIDPNLKVTREIKYGKKY